MKSQTGIKTEVVIQNWQIDLESCIILYHLVYNNRFKATWFD